MRRDGRTSETGETREEDRRQKADCVKSRRQPFDKLRAWSKKSGVRIQEKTILKGRAKADSTLPISSLLLGTRFA